MLFGDHLRPKEALQGFPLQGKILRGLLPLWCDWRQPGLLQEATSRCRQRARPGEGGGGRGQWRRVEGRSRGQVSQWIRAACGDTDTIPQCGPRTGRAAGPGLDSLPPSVSELAQARSRSGSGPGPPAGRARSQLGGPGRDRAGLRLLPPQP